MSTKKTKVTVDKKGKVRVELEGYRGVGCLEALRKILAGLGRVDNLEPTAEYYETTTDTKILEYE